MPSPLVPPPANDIGAQSFPRTLQRWLDINPVTKLDRVGSFITLPAFSVNTSWNGLSDIVAAFNFEGSNNFSLKALGSVPVSPNYLLAISWRDNSGNLFRYAIWKNVGENIPFVLPLYTGQEIKKNFRFEIWNTNSTPTLQPTALNFTTSVLGGVDYRWGTNFQLVGSDGLVTNFNSINTILLLNQTSIKNRWVSTSGVIGGPDITSWADTIDGAILLPTGTVEIDNAFKSVGIFPTDAGATLSCSGLSGSIGLLFLVINLPADATSGTLLNNGNGYTVIFNSVASTITVGTSTVPITLGNDTIITADSFNSKLRAFDLSTGLVSIGTGNIGAFETITLTIGNLHSGFAEILLYTLEDEDLTIYYQILGYLINTYANGISVPITFPTNAASQTN